MVLVFICVCIFCFFRFVRCVFLVHVVLFILVGLCIRLWFVVLV